MKIFGSKFCKWSNTKRQLLKTTICFSYIIFESLYWLVASVHGPLKLIICSVLLCRVMIFFTALLSVWPQIWQPYLKCELKFKGLSICRNICRSAFSKLKRFLFQIPMTLCSCYLTIIFFGMLLGVTHCASDF